MKTQTQPQTLPMGSAPGSQHDSQQDSTYVDVASIPWTKQRFPGIETKLLMENKATGMLTALFRWAPGARLPDHQHVGIEQTYVIEGSFADADGVYTAGNYVWRRAGSRHDAWSDEGCVTLAIFQKPNTFFD